MQFIKEFSPNAHLLHTQWCEALHQAFTKGILEKEANAKNAAEFKIAKKAKDPVRALINSGYSGVPACMLWAIKQRVDLFNESCADDTPHLSCGSGSSHIWIAPLGGRIQDRLVIINY